ncbi:hypothetical protein [Pseudolysinimonas sp.]|uniref:hypothetical protein n=1 Tax=Pseudolysinimonas sp. TaxID=2680009 RepID=UPI003F80911E
MRAVLSLIVAIVTTVVGESLLWGAGTALTRGALEAGGLDQRAALSASIAVVGIVLVALAMLTAGWSSLGVIVVGAIHLVAGAAALLVSPAIYYAVLRPLHQANQSVATGVDYAAATGMLLLTGVVMFVGGIALAARKARSGVAGRVVSVILAFVLGVGLLPVLAIGGSRVVQAVLLRLSAVVELFGALLVLAAAVLLVIVVATVRWSSLGALVLGIVLAAAGFGALFVPPALAPVSALDAQVGRGAGYLVGTGQLALLGMLLLATAIAGLVRGAQRRRLEPEPEVEESIGYQRETPLRTMDEIFPRTTSVYDPPAPPPSDRV